MRTIHMCMSVRGILNWPRVELKRGLKYITKDDGSKFSSVEELRNAFMDELSKGHEVIPMGSCEGFDYKTGCPGHEQPPHIDSDRAIGQTDWDREQQESGRLNKQ